MDKLFKNRKGKTRKSRKRAGSNDDKKHKIPPKRRKLIQMFRTFSVSSKQKVFRGTKIQRPDNQSLMEQDVHLNDDALKTLLKEIQIKQKKRFSYFQLPRSLWLSKKILPLEELFVELTIKVKSERKDEERVIHWDEIFHEEPLKNVPLRILIEGHAGYGKTTLVAKFLYDWSREEKYIWDKFDLVFVIPLRKYEKNLESHLLDQCEGGKADQKEILQVIESSQNRILLFLDGLDECNDSVKKSLLPLLKRTQYPNMTVVLTCRTGFLHLKNKNFCSNAHVKVFNKFENQPVWDKRIQIKGISRERRSEFLQKYLNVEVIELEKKLDHRNLKLNDFYACPLFLLLLAVLIQERNVEITESKTQLYKTIFNFVINRSLAREKSLKDTEYDVFEVKMEESVYRHLLINFGRLCLEKVKKKKLIFEENEVLSCSKKGANVIIKSGLLSNQFSFVRVREEAAQYKPCHKSFVEFLAAFYLSTLKENELEIEIQELLLTYDICPKKEQLLYPFLAGFLHSNAFILFKILSHYKSLITIFDDNFSFNTEEVLMEIQDLTDIRKYLTKFPLIFLENVQYKETFRNLYPYLMHHCQKQRREIFLKIPENINIINSLPENLKINEIRLAADQFDSIQNKLKIKEIHCQDLLIYSNGFANEFPLSLKETLSNIKAEKVWMKINYYDADNEAVDNNLVHFFKEIMPHYLKYFNFHYLSLHFIPMDLFHLISCEIQSLINSRSIEYGLHIQLISRGTDCFSAIDWNSFADVILNSHLKSFGVDNYCSSVRPLQFPLNHSRRIKKWKFIGVKGLFTLLDFKESDILSVEHLCWTEFRFPEEFSLVELLLKCINIQRLTCDYGLISSFSKCDSISSWEGFKTIKQLDLFVPNMIFIPLFLENVSLFKAVQEVHFFQFINSELLIEVISRLPSVNKISVHSYLDFVEFLKKLLILNEKQGIGNTLHEVEIDNNISHISSEKSFTKHLKSCFEKFADLKLSVLNTSIAIIKELFKGFLGKKEYVIICEPESNPFSKEIIPVDEFPQLGIKFRISHKKGQ